MRQLLFVLTICAAALSFSLSAQDAPARGGGGKAAPKNLKVLTPEEVRPAMGQATSGLGVQCAACHVAGDFASDDNPKKGMARMMFTMTKELNAKFPDGKAHVSCYTCHRGAEEPLMAAPPKQ